MANTPEPRVETRTESMLVGLKVCMSFTVNRNQELWQRFMKNRAAIQHIKNSDLFAVDVYPDTAFFSQFDPSREFEKWAAVEVTIAEAIPGNCELFLLPAGVYAVFPYKGRASEGQAFYQYIYGSWIPGSEFELDHRPHFALMGANYKGNDPDSEEEIWIPIRKKTQA